MEIDERINALIAEIETTKQDMQKLLLDIRVVILEAQNPTGAVRLTAGINTGVDKPKSSTGVKTDER
jgi:hypothetical protein